MQRLEADALRSYGKDLLGDVDGDADQLFENFNRKANPLDELSGSANSLSSQLDALRQLLTSTHECLLRTVSKQVDRASQLEAEVADLNIENHELHEKLCYTSLNKSSSSHSCGGETGGTGEAALATPMQKKANHRKHVPAPGPVSPRANEDVPGAQGASSKNKSSTLGMKVDSFAEASASKPKAAELPGTVEPAPHQLMQDVKDTCGQADFFEESTNMVEPGQLTSVVPTPSETKKKPIEKAWVDTAPAPEGLASSSLTSQQSEALGGGGSLVQSEPTVMSLQTAPSIHHHHKSQLIPGTSGTSNSRVSRLQGNSVYESPTTKLKSFVSAGDHGGGITSGGMSARDVKAGLKSSMLKDNMQYSSQGENAKIQSEMGAPVFVDAAAMKEKLRAAIGKHEYNVTDLYHETGYFQHIARSRVMELMTLVIIGINAIWIWIDTDYNHEDLLIDANPVFVVAENLFCSFFVFEWFVRFMSFRRKRDGLHDRWFVFDSILAATMVLETWLLSLLALIGGMGRPGTGFINPSVLKLFRLVRLSRLSRLVRLLKAMPELMILIKGMAVAMRSVFFTLCLLLGFVYIFAIMFVQLLGPRGAFVEGSDVGDTYFETVPEAMNNLLLYGAFPDQKDFIMEINAASVVMYFLLMLFFLLASITVMNMLVGILCEVVSVVSNVEKETLLVGFVKHQLMSMLTASGIDANGDFQISKTEFQTLLEKPDAARALVDVGVDVIGLVDITDFVFQGDKELSFGEFMDMILQLRGSNVATVKDIVDLRKLLVTEIEHLADILGNSGEMTPVDDDAMNAKVSYSKRTDKAYSVLMDR